MFLSKGYLSLRNSVSKVFCENLVPTRLLSTAAVDVQQSTNTAVPDKLYKKIALELRGNDKEVMSSYAKFATMAADNLGIVVERNTALPRPIHERLTVLKSVHVHKKHRVQYETRTYYRYLDFVRLTGSTADTFLEYIQRNLPEGVAVKITKVEIQRIPESAIAPSN